MNILTKTALIRNIYFPIALGARLMRYVGDKYPDSKRALSFVVQNFVREGLDREGFETDGKKKHQ